MTLRVRCAYKVGGQGHVGGETFCASVHAEWFLRTIYCAKTRPNTESKYRSWSRRGMGRRAPRIMREYDRAATITIRASTQPRACEMGSSSFSATIWLKVATTTRASLPIMPSTESHRWELLVNYPVFILVMVIYHYVEIIWRILVTQVFLYNICDNEKMYPREPVNIHIQ